MVDFNERDSARACLRVAKAVALCATAAFSGAASAHNYTFWGVDAEWKLVGNYALAVRTKNPSDDLINGPVDPLNISINQQDVQEGQAFGHTGLRQMMNFDDGDRNFRQWSLVHNRVSLFAEVHASTEHFGIHGSADGFLDQAYRRKNRNDSPGTINKDGEHNEFTHDARIFDGGRARLLEAYAYTDWMLFDEMALNLRVGRHVAAWGESLFLSGIMLAQNRADATRAYVPGAEIKEILLPTNQVSGSFQPLTNFTLLGYYKFAFTPTEIFPVGDFLAVQDVVGPGAQFVYGSVNPLYLENCVGVFTSIFTGIGVPEPLAGTAGGAAESLCDLNGAGGTVFNAPPYIKVYRQDDIRARNGGQWGTGVKWQITPVTNLGFYYLRYHDSNPSVKLNMGYAHIGQIGPRELTTELFFQTVPVTYNIKYFDDIRLMGTSISTVLGDFNVAGEVLYRERVPTSVKAIISQVLAPVATRGKIGQVLLSAIYVGNPKFIYDDFAWVGEFGYFRLLDADPIYPEPGVRPVGNGDEPFYDVNSFGFQMLAFANVHNIISGWDLKNQIAYGEITKGNPSLTAAFGALYGEGDRRLGVSGSMTYLQNLEIALSYNFFFGSTTKNIGESSLRQHPYADRDYASINVKYNF